MSTRARKHVTRACEKCRHAKAKVCGTPLDALKSPKNTATVPICILYNRGSVNWTLKGSIYKLKLQLSIWHCRGTNEP